MPVLKLAVLGLAALAAFIDNLTFSPTCPPPVTGLPRRTH